VSEWREGGRKEEAAGSASKQSSRNVVMEGELMVSSSAVVQ
jgi:hypothetical protein